MGAAVCFISLFVPLGVILSVQTNPFIQPTTRNNPLKPAPFCSDHRRYQLPVESGEDGRQLSEAGNENIPSSSPSPSSTATRTRASDGETATFEVTTEAGGGGAYEWLDNSSGGDGEGGVEGGGGAAGGKGSWVAMPMRWHREGFPVGVLFVRLAGGLLLFVLGSVVLWVFLVYSVIFGMPESTPVGLLPSSAPSLLHTHTRTYTLCTIPPTDHHH
jgi:hypothetical protein